MEWIMVVANGLNCLEMTKKRNEKNKSMYLSCLRVHSKSQRTCLSPFKQTSLNNSLDAKQTLTCELRQRPHQTSNKEAKVQINKM